MIKVLAVASEIYCETLQSDAITGLSVMVRDIYNEVSKEYDSYLFSSRYNLCKEDISPTLHIVDSRIDHWKRNVKLIDLFKAVVYFPFGLKRIKKIIRESALLRTQINAFEYYLNTIKPDIINFHEFDNLNTILLQKCMERNIKCVITNHLYIGNSHGCSNYTNIRKNERIILNLNNVNVSVICSGMKKRMLADYSSLSAKNVFLTMNGTSFAQSTSSSNSMFFSNTLVPEKKIILCIGNVMERKNQTQLIRAVSKMKKDERRQFVIYFLGSDPKGILLKTIQNLKCEDVCVYKGKVRTDEICDYYQRAFAVITTTFCEGFGLTIIEGYSYGKPAIIPYDIDSFSDLYSPDCSISINGREDNDICNAILSCISKNWDSKTIIKKSQTYSMKKCGESYINMYNKILQNK